jgi:hypothetical protein
MIGYSYKVLDKIPGMESANLHFSDFESRIQLLNHIQSRDEVSLFSKYVDEDDAQLFASRIMGTASSLSGGAHRSYKEKKRDGIFYSSPRYDMYKERNKYRKTE